MKPKTTPDTILKDGFRVTVTPKHIAGEVSPIKLRSFVRYIESIGFTRYGSGKGDHEIWKDAAGKKLTINPLDGDKKHVDMACLKRLATILGCNFGDARNIILKFDRH